MSAFRRYPILFGLGGLSHISVSSQPFFIVEGSFAMYYSVVWTTRRDERFACPRSGAIPHYLAFGRLCCISVSSPLFFNIKGSFLMYSNVVWRARRDERCACPRSRYISYYLVWEAYAISRSVIYRRRLVLNAFWCRLKDPKRRVVRVAAFCKYSTLSGFWGVMLYLSKFSTVFYR
jgi:hypothetical protein